MRSNSREHAHPSSSGCSGHNHNHQHDSQEQVQVHAIKCNGVDHCVSTNGNAGAASWRPNADNAKRKAYARKLKHVTVFVVLFFLIEIAGSIFSGSLAIASDAAHLLTDIIGWVLAIVANEIAGLPPSEKLTFGPVRAEVLSALFSTMFILVLSVFLAYSAVCRLIDLWKGEAKPIDGRLMSFIALLGIFVNITLLLIFAHDEHGRCQAHGHHHRNQHGQNDDGCDKDDHCGEQGTLVDGHSCGQAAAPTSASPTTGERSSLMDTLSSSFNRDKISIVGGNSVNSEAEVGSTEHYGSIAEKTEATRVRMEVVDLEEEEEKERRMRKNINVEAARLHAVTDLVQSFGVLLAGLLIWYDPQWQWADPISTLVFVALVMNSTRWLLSRAFNVLLEGVPEEVNYKLLKSRLGGITGVVDVHCLHVWSLTMGQPVVSAHIKARDPEVALIEAHQICRQMGIGHATIQVEKDDELSMMI